MARSPHGEEPTKEIPLWVGTAPVSAPTTAIPYTEPTIVAQPPRRRFGMVLLGMFAVGLIVLAGGLIAGYSLSQTGKPSKGNTSVPQAQATTKPPSPTPKADTPTQVTERFLTAALAGNEATMHEQLCGLLKGEGKKDNAGSLGLGLFVGYKMVGENISGPTASVEVELTVPLLGALNFDIYLLRESGGWRVCGAGPT